MSGDTVTISKDAHMTAIKYGPNVSKGILAMEKKIVEQEKDIGKMGAWIEERV